MAYGESVRARHHFPLLWDKSHPIALDESHFPSSYFPLRSFRNLSSSDVRECACPRHFIPLISPPPLGPASPNSRLTYSVTSPLYNVSKIPIISPYLNLDVFKYYTVNHVYKGLCIEDVQELPLSPRPRWLLPLGRRVPSHTPSIDSNGRELQQIFFSYALFSLHLRSASFMPVQLFFEKSFPMLKR